jgi:hypothetical protein
VTQVAAASVVRTTEGDRLAGYIYGTIVALSVIVEGARASPEHPGSVAAIVTVTSVVFWLAHVYAHWVGQTVTRGGRLSFGKLRHIAWRELPLIEAGLLPVLALVLGEVGLVSVSHCYWLAFGFGMILLVSQGVRFARIERLGFLASCGVVLANGLLGLLLIGLKLVATH